VEIPSNFSGGCACGAVRYECSSAPVAMVNCHCRDCQRASGAGYTPVVIVRPTHFLLTRGQPKYHEVIAESGSTARRAFCAVCGSPLFASSSAHPDFVGIKAGSLDNPSWFRATVDVWTASAQPWDALNDSTTKFPGNPSRRRDA
jgi:hypothetical protein